MYVPARPAMELNCSFVEAETVHRVTIIIEQDYCYAVQSRNYPKKVCLT